MSTNPEKYALNKSEEKQNQRKKKAEGEYNQTSENNRAIHSILCVFWSVC